MWSGIRCLGVALLCVAFAASVAADKAEPQVRIDPVTRYVQITYQVPQNAPQETLVRCSWSPADRGEWRPTAAKPLLSETGYALTPASDWDEWDQGRIVERRAAGLSRTVVINPFPDMQVGGKVDADVRLEIASTDGRAIDTRNVRIRCDNSDVVNLTDWTRVLQADAVSDRPVDWKWLLGADKILTGKAGVVLPQLTYPLDLKGPHAVFVRTVPGRGGIGVRLSGDERTEVLKSARASDEMLWRWTAMDREHLVLKQPHSYTGWEAASVRSVRFVPLSEDAFEKLERRFSDRHDKIVAGYFEPYSWAFFENVQTNLQHREPLGAFRDARVDIVDAQLGRFGAKMVYETRLSDQLVAGTFGDPIDGKVPATGNVGRMQQYTSTLRSELKYADELGLTLHANFGATNCYIGTPLQGDITKRHPEWVRGAVLRYELPEVRLYIISHFREAIELGAPGVSIDFCRYPEGIDKAETCTVFLRELRAAVGPKIPLLVRFPAKGVRLWENFDYAAWVREGLVDFLCPSNLQGRHLTFDIGPYAKAVKGTACKLLPVVDALGWGLPLPGMFLQRVRKIYDAGADGVYIYQADGPVVHRPLDRRYIPIAGSSDALARWFEEDDGMRTRSSKGIFITGPMRDGVYHPYERLRVWLEGIPEGGVEIFLDGKPISRFDGPPYLLGTEENESDGVIPPGEHKLRVRAKDGDGWLEREFLIRGA